MRTKPLRPLRTGGYTIIELLVVMLVLAVLAMAVMPLAEVTAQRSKEQELKRALWEIRDAIDAYKRAHDAGAIRARQGGTGYPAKLSDLVEGLPDARAEKAGQRLHFLRRIPRDPFAEHGTPAELTWGLRSYQSSAAQPMPGADVYDVYSRSPAVGLNGVPLKEW